MPLINKKYPGKSAQEIYEAVHKVMQRLTDKMGLNYDTDASSKAGTVSKMGIKGEYLAREGEVTVELKFPMIVPGAVKKQVQEDIERRLDKLFS